MTAPAPAKLALSTRSVASLLDVSERQIREWLATGGIGPVPCKLGDRLARFDREEVAHWWQTCRAEGRRIGRAEWLAMQKGTR